MEYVDGRSLRDLLRAGELTPETSVRPLEVLSALEASHRAGIVHGDITANVMVTSAGAVKHPVSVAYQHVHEEPRGPTQDVPALDSAITKALAKDRNERFQSAQAFREALQSATKASPTTTALIRPPLVHGTRLKSHPA